MPAPHPPEFRRRAVELARGKAAPVAQIAKDLGISESCLRNWMARADIDKGKKQGSGGHLVQRPSAAARTAPADPSRPL